MHLLKPRLLLLVIASGGLLRTTETSGVCHRVYRNARKADDVLITSSFVLKHGRARIFCPELKFRLEYSDIPVLPHHVITGGSKFHANEFSFELYKTNVSLLSAKLPGYSPFEYLAFRTGTFLIEDSGSLIGWNWGVLKDFKPCTPCGGELGFDIRNTELVYLSSNFGEVGGGAATAVKIHRCGLRWLGAGVFAPLEKLRVLELTENLLKNVERSHLPRKAPNLQNIDLRKNLLTHISEDLFTGLDNLQCIHLEGNRLQQPVAGNSLCSNNYYHLGLKDENHANLSMPNRTEKL